MTSPPEPYRLTALTAAPPGLRRALHGHSTAGTWRRLAVRVGQLAFEVAGALPRDALRAWRGGAPPPLRIEDGLDPRPGAPGVALYVHFSASGRLSEMVRRQLDGLARAGFGIVFITMAETVPEADWQAARQHCALVVQRRNFARDFGAWQDLAGEAQRRWPGAGELLLTNDSVLGPIRPLAPILAVLRAGGDGLFGLTESLQGGPHLQSYFLLARGRDAVGDLFLFLNRMRMSHSKWLVVNRGELRVARWMRRRGHRVAALFGYRRVVAAALADPAERDLLARAHPALAALESLSPETREALLLSQPLNPTHHLWHAQACRLGCPFLKTELIRRNPGRLPDVETWREVVPATAPCPVPVIEAHLHLMDTPVMRGTGQDSFQVA